MQEAAASETKARAQLLAVTVAIKWESPGRALHTQASITRHGRRFEVLSFRIVEGIRIMNGGDQISPGLAGFSNTPD